MTDTKHPLAAIDRGTATDRELITLVRSGDCDAYEELYLRHHDVALRYARQFTESGRAEDLCAEAFAKILDLLQRGMGPDRAFRAYLLTTVRTSYLNTIRAGGREDLVPDHEPTSRMTSVVEDADARFDQYAIGRAFARLPQRWQAALWLTTVEGLSNKEAGEHLGIKVNAVASLSFRARAGLREAYLAQHLLETTDARCRRVLEQAPSYLRNTLGPRRHRLVTDHVTACSSCSAAFLELTHVDASLRAALIPLLATGFTAASLAAPAHALAGLVATVKSWGSGTVTAVAVSAAAVTVAVLGVASGALAPDVRDDPVPEQVVDGRPEADRLSIPRGGVPAPVRPTPPVPTPTPLAAAPSSTVLTLPKPIATPPAPAPVPTTSVQPAPTTSPSPGPTSTPPSTTVPPTPTPPTPTPPTPTAREMSIGTMQSSTVDPGPSTWRRATVPVTNPAPGTVLRLIAVRTRSARLVPASSGWTCSTPRMAWSGATGGSASTECVYDGTGDGSALQIEYRVDARARLTAELTPPNGFLDTSLLDNSGVLDLLG